MTRTTTTTTTTRRALDREPPSSTRGPLASAPVRISRALLDEIVAHARAEAPNECCGMIATRDGEAVAVHRARNAAASPLRYEIDRMEQFRIQTAIEDAGLELGAIYHSHTRSDPDAVADRHQPRVLSRRAVRDRRGQGREEPDVRAWRIVDGAVSEAALEVEVD